MEKICTNFLDIFVTFFAPWQMGRKFMLPTVAHIPTFQVKPKCPVIGKFKKSTWQNITKVRMIVIVFIVWYSFTGPAQHRKTTVVWDRF